MKIDWHREALEDLRRLGEPAQRRIRKVLIELSKLDDPRQKLLPYSGNMKVSGGCEPVITASSASFLKGMAVSCWS